MKTAPEKIRILVVDDAEDTLEIVKRNLTNAGYTVITAVNVPQGLSVLESEPVDIVLTDWKMPKVNGMEFIRHIRGNYDSVEVMMMTGYATVEGAVEAVKTGAEEYLTKPFTEKELLHAVKKVVEKIEMKRALQEGGREDDLRELPGLVWCSSAMERVTRTVMKVAESSATVLITGESGTGKELVARAIHYNSPRSQAPFVTINCGAIPETLLESELFGYVRGAFTGADKSRAGFFQTADQGTIFLDEISETSLSMQIKLLRVLQEREIFMVGSSKPCKIDVRVIAATNKDLLTLIKKGLFREDLYYRLNVLTIDIPPLRERKKDIPLLAAHFVGKHTENYGDKVITVSDKTMDALQCYSWPGNVRELENIMQRLVVMNTSGVIEVSDLPQSMRFYIESSENAEKSLVQVEAEHIQRVLRHTGGNKTRAAEILGIDRKTLREKLKQIEGE